MKITIKTKSLLLSASGESTAHIDADVKYDKYGFPYIQAKTFKGLLRESALEVCEIHNVEKNIVGELFGIKGRAKSGILSFNNLKIKGYGTIQTDLNKHKGVLSPEIVKKHFTEIRQQTTISKDGTAKAKSLRKYRLIKEGTTFETTIENVPIDKKVFVRNSLINLRYVGTRRNRGFGKIEISTDETTEKIVDINPVIKNSNDVEAKSMCKLTFDILTLDTLLIAKIFGEQNTVSTEKYIPAHNIRGLVAGLIIKSKNVSYNVHNEPTFNKIILSGEVKFNNAFVKEALPIPKIYGYNKIKSDSKAEFIFEKNEPLKVMNGFAKMTETKIASMDVETTFSIHNSRSENRIAGRSILDEGAIFYYEGIAPDQNFFGELVGSKSDLMYIHELLLQNKGIHRIGKSKTAQYSKVIFTNFNISDFIGADNQEIKSPVYIVFQSPLVTYNEFGMAIPDLTVLQKELSSFIQPIDQISIASSPCKIENYMGIWQSKTPREAAFDIGTTLKVEFEGKINSEKLFELELAGLGERKSEGYGRIKVMDLKKSQERETVTDSSGLSQKISPINVNSITEEKPAQTPTEITNPFDPDSVLYEIFEEQVEQEASNELKLVAIEKASKKYGKLPNSLISKLKDILDGSNDFSMWNTEMIELKGKKAFETMEKANLWNSISKLNIPSEIANNKVFLVRKSYWMAYFNALRVKQIKSGKNDKL